MLVFFVSEEMNDIDLDHIRLNLNLTPTERLVRHQQALDLMRELQKARKQIYGESKHPSEDSHSVEN